MSVSLPSQLSIPQLWRSYKQWVARNPQVIGDVETTVKWASYFVAGRFTSSNLVTEMIYSLSNLVSLLNDRILIESVKADSGNNDEFARSTHQIKLFLTTLEYCEVFLELSGQRLWGTKGRWAIIILLQLIKCIGRLILVMKKREQFVRSPPIPTVDRQNVSVSVLTENYPIDSGEGGFRTDNVSKLKKSGKLMRRIENSPPVHLRDWKPLQEKAGIDPKMLFNTAEFLYIMKPMVHLGSVGLFGYTSWKSWTVAMVLDFVSIRMYFKRRQQLTKAQRLELSKRCLIMFMYLLRSPCYDRYTKDMIDYTLGGLSRRVPFARFICQPLAKYIPVWQSSYFYMWST